MFEKLFGGGAAAQEHKLMLEAEQRQMGFGREQTIMGGTMHPSDDQTYLAMKQERESFVRWQQDLIESVERMKHQLRRHSRNQETGKYERIMVPTGERDLNGKLVYAPLPPLLNELGINMIEEEVSPLMGKNIINSNFDEERILRILKYTGKVISRNLAYNYDTYDMDALQYEHIMRIVKNHIIAAPFRAWNNGERKYAGGIIKRIESVSEGAQQQQKKGMFG